MTRPLLKWAGGKRQLLPHLRRFYPSSFNRYIEPFVGSGAVFFDLHASGRLRDHDVVLIDSNADLIGCYETVRDAPHAIADALERLAAAHAIEGDSHYLAVRNERFNPMRDRLRRADGGLTYTPELAAMFIYLNRTGFNGLFRLNRRGEFNVPPGRYLRPRIADGERLARVAEALASTGVRLIWGGFERACEIAELYEGCDVVRAAGLRTLRVAARRAINSNASRRGPVEEYLITNVTADSTYAPASQTS